MSLIVIVFSHKQSSLSEIFLFRSRFLAFEESQLLSVNILSAKGHSISIRLQVTIIESRLDFLLISRYALLSPCYLLFSITFSSSFCQMIIILLSSLSPNDQAADSYASVENWKLRNCPEYIKYAKYSDFGDTCQIRTIF